jgi:hypothetical protein
VADDSIVLWIDFNDQSANDRSLQYNHGTPQGGVHYVSDGVVGGCFEFDGTNDYVDSNYQPYVNTFSVSSWVKIDDYGVNQIIAARDLTGLGGDYFMVDIDSDGYLGGIFGYNGGGGSGTVVVLSDDGVQLSLNSWYYITVVGNGTHLIRYVNGIQTGTIDAESFDELDIDADLFIGAENDLHTGLENPFNGKIDQPRIYNRALSAQEIQRIYNEEQPK